MNDLCLKLYVKVQGLLNREEGQDLTEYSLVICLSALAAISGAKHVGAAVTTVFSNVSGSLA
jgi:Flp pilus assembly pilin Flp